VVLDWPTRRVAVGGGRFYRVGVRDPLANPAPLVRRVYAYVAYRIGAGADAEDVTSETFERALRYRDSFDPRRGDAAAWLIGIARRCLADRALRAAPTAAETPEEAVASHEGDRLRSIELAGAVATLGERDREIIALRFGADMTVREIANVLELRTNTVEVALHRALARLRDELSEPHEAAPLPRTGPVADSCA
jgi:RNA polymerase sigma factor (sigma-70 family)